jgi:hypothetical protein
LFRDPADFHGVELAEEVPVLNHVGKGAERENGETEMLAKATVDPVRQLTELMMKRTMLMIHGEHVLVSGH